MNLREELEKICREFQRIANQAREDRLILTEATAVTHLGNLARDIALENESCYPQIYERYKHALEITK